MLKRTLSGLQSRSQLVLIAAVVLVACFFRLYRLDAIPSGLSTDEAAAGVNAESVLDGNLQLFYPPFDEPVFVYASSVGIALFGPTVLGLHVAAAVFGILSVIAIYLLGREMFDSRVAILAAAGLALSYWGVQTSRLGFRAIALPCLELLAFFFLWRALKRGQIRDYVFGGIFLALAMYTYPSSRVVPLIVLILLVLAIVNRNSRPANPRGLVFFAAIFAVTVLPFVAYFLIHPEDFTGRFAEASSVSGGAAPLSSGLVDSLVKTAGMFAFSGDPQWKYNLSGQPVFNPIWAALFAAGLVIALFHVSKREYVFLILWFALGLLPGILTGEAPHNLRTIVSQPTVYFFPALAIAASLERVVPKNLRAMAFAYGVVAVLFAVTAVNTFQDYFVRWANEPKVAELFYPDVARAMSYLKTVDRSEPVYISAQSQDLITVMRNYFAWRQPMPLPRLFDASQGLVLNTGVPRAIYLLPVSAPPSPNVQAVLSRGTLLKQERTDGGRVLFQAYSLQNLALPQPSARLDGRFGDLAQVKGYDLSGSLRSGDTLSVTLYSKPLKQANQEGEYKFFVHLIDSTGYLWSQAEGIGGDPAQWSDDELVMTTLPLTVPADAPPKEYSLEFGLYSLQRGRLPLLDSQSHVQGTSLASAPFRLAQANAGIDVPNQATHLLQDLPLGDQLAIAGFDADEQVDPGSALRITLYWKALGSPQRDDQLRLSLLDPSGGSVAEMRGELVDPLFPTTVWAPNRLVRNSYMLSIPSETAAGTYKISVNLIDGATSNSVASGVALSSVQVSNITHRYNVPTIQNPLSATLGDVIDFLGFDIASSVKPGAQLNLSLYWRDKKPMTVSYTVFVHLLDDNKVIAQRDRAPVNGQRPTTSWVAGEVIADRFRIPIPADLKPGQYTLEVGMYNPDTLERLPLFGPTGDRMEGDRLLIGNVLVSKP